MNFRLFRTSRRLLACNRSYVPCKPSSYRHMSSAIEADAIRAHSITHPSDFWHAAAQNIDWIKPYKQALHVDEHGYGHWFVDGLMNTSYNCLDRHIASGRGDALALIYDSPVSNCIKKYTYSALCDEVCKAATVLRQLGVNKGDRVVIYMPNIPEAVISMLACARIGAVHSVVFGGFAAPELATRIKDCTPKVVIGASCGIDGAKLVDYKLLLDQALQLAAETHQVSSCLIYQRAELPAKLQKGRDIDWQQAIQRLAHVDRSYEALEAQHPLYILYTSGTTGSPKGVVRDNGGHAVALNWSMSNIYDAKEGDVYWAASDVGWVVGHSYIVYGPLLQGCTTVLYEGKPVGTPDAANFWRTAERHSVNILFTAPTALRAIKRLDPHGELSTGFNLSSFRALFLAGERADPDSLKWAEHTLHHKVIDHWWQTETGWAICANALGMEGTLVVKPGSTAKACPGYAVHVLDDEHNELPRGREHAGRLAIKLPLPPGALLTLYNAPQRFLQAYLQAIPGYYDTGDMGYIDEEGYVFVMARSDDVLNVAGHRLSSGALEEVLAANEEVAEVAVVGMRDVLKGQLPLALVVLTSQPKQSQDLIKQQLVAMVRHSIGPVAAFKNVLFVDRLPKTRSGKILRKLLRQLADDPQGQGEPVPLPATLEDPQTVQEIRLMLSQATLLH